MHKRTIAAVLGAAALAVPAAAVAQPGHGKGHEKRAAKQETKGKGKSKGSKPKTVTFVFKGTFTAPGTVEVTAGNGHVRKGGFVGEPVAFDFADAKLVVADTNADQVVDLSDVVDGDRVVVKARVAKGTEFAAPAEGEEAAAAIVARKLVDQAHPPADEDEGGEAPAE